MPSLGADMAAGTLLEWRVGPGDRVHRGDVVALIETDKAEIEVEAFTEGVVEKLLVAPGAKVPVGTPLARLAAAGVSAPQPPPPAAPPQAAPPPPPAAAPARAAVAPAAPPPRAERRRVSPLARRIAQERGIELDSLVGTGEGGAVTRDDVERAAAARVSEAPPEPAPAAPARATARAAERALAMRRAIAAAMTRSKREIPHYYLATRIPLERAMRWLEQENQRRPVAERVLPAVLLLKASALALRKTPELNGFFREDEFVASEAIHLGVAISLRSGGLVAPALHDADRRPLGELMALLRDLVQRARSGVLRSSELADPTVTVTNVGDQGADSVFGVIYPPQVALIGFGRVREEPWAQSGMVGARPVVTATLAADHRASDGHRGGLFLAALAQLLQSPESL
jgi:pyruvate dehydrogenase E2 component (dihydrolipoamide acetyltransferase)